MECWLRQTKRLVPQAKHMVPREEHSVHHGEQLVPPVEFLVARLVPYYLVQIDWVWKTLLFL
jgi:hypothetical protein